MKILNAIFICGVISILGFILYPAYSAIRPDWPEITEDKKERILEFASGLEDGRVAPEDWILEIEEMKPRSVYFEKGVLEIILSSGGIGPGWGYLVLQEEKEIRGYKILRSKDPRFIRFKQMH